MDLQNLTPAMIGLAAALLLAGIIVGWFLRGTRIRREKDAINAGWQEQLSVQKTEHDRIAEQNKSLMEQISQYRVSKKDADRQVSDMTESLRTAQSEREYLDKELREVRSNLEVSIKQRDQLKQDWDNAGARQMARDASLKEKDEKIFKLSREVETWQNRLPPLLERFRERNLEAEQLGVELDKANERIAELEKLRPPPGDTRIEPVQDASLSTNLDASNEQYDETSEASILTQTTGDVHESADDQPVDQIADPEHTDRLAVKRDVDFDLGTDGVDHAAESMTEQSIAEVFSDDSASVRVDELLSSGETPVDTETFATLDDADRSERAAANGSNGSVDDLQRIKGVGPAIEKTLNRLGFFQFKQIAGMSEVDIDRVANELRGFRSRIYREDWIGQARLLAHDAAGESS